MIPYVGIRENQTKKIGKERIKQHKYINFCMPLKLFLRLFELCTGPSCLEQLRHNEKPQPGL